MLLPKNMRSAVRTVNSCRHRLIPVDFKIKHTKTSDAFESCEASMMFKQHIPMQFKAMILNNKILAASLSLDHWSCGHKV